MKVRRIYLFRIAVYALLLPAPSFALDVVFLTRMETGVTTTVLKSWTPAELQALAGHNGNISAQKLIIDDSTTKLELNARADIDLVTIYGETEIARVPRFMIWRGLLKLQWDKKNQTLQAYASGKNRLLVPTESFKVNHIQKIELAHHSLVYPGTALKLRTNPAASRGEKLFTQSCLACHSLPKIAPLKPEQLTAEGLKKFSSQHKIDKDLDLDARGVRGLIAYSQALASEKNEVKSNK